MKWMVKSSDLYYDYETLRIKVSWRNDKYFPGQRRHETQNRRDACYSEDVVDFLTIFQQSPHHELGCFALPKENAVGDWAFSIEYS